MRRRTWAPGSISVLDYVVRTASLPLTSYGRLVYLALFSRMDARCICFPSVSRLAKELGLSDRTIQRQLRGLEEAGLIEHESFGGGRSSAVYRLRPPWVLEGNISDMDSGVSDSHRCQGDVAAMALGHTSGVSVAPEETPSEKPSLQSMGEAPELPVKSVWDRVVGRVTPLIARPTARALRSCQVDEGSDGRTIRLLAPEDPDDRNHIRWCLPVLRQALKETVGADCELDAAWTQPPSSSGGNGAMSG